MNLIPEQMLSLGARWCLAYQLSSGHVYRIMNIDMNFDKQAKLFATAMYLICNSLSAVLLNTKVHVCKVVSFISSVRVELISLPAH